MDKKFCENCGAKLEPGAMFCPTGDGIPEVRSVGARGQEASQQAMVKELNG